MPREPTIPEKIEAMLDGLRQSGMRPGEIAKAAHLSRQTVYRLSVGYCRAPSFDTVVAIEAIYRARLEPEQ